MSANEGTAAKLRRDDFGSNRPRLSENYLRFPKVEEQHLELDQFDVSIPFQDAYLLAGGEIFTFVVVLLSFHT